MTVHLNIGTNIGRRHANLGQAAAALSLCLPGRMTLSEPVESEPWGFVSDNRFLNMAAAIELDGPMDPLEILGRVQEAERSVCADSHRTASGGYADRVIDIDIIAVDAIVMSDPRLTLPHPRMHLRPFVLIPMAETAPGWIHPILGLTPGLMLQRL